MKIEQRRERRSHVYLTALLHTPEGGGEVKLSDLSSKGACARYPVALETGSEVRISRGDLTISARIAWAAEGKLGLEFDTLIDVAAFRSQTHAAPSPEARALFKPVDRLSRRMEQHWANVWKR